MLALENFILLSLITFIGLICGSFLIIFFAYEEHAKGEEYFVILQRVTIVLIALFLIYQTIFSFSIWNIILAAMLLMLFGFTYKNINNHYFYILFALILVFNTKNPISALVVSTLIFFYGIVAGTLIVREYEWKDALLNCLTYIHYPILSVILFLVLPLFIPNL